MCASCMSCTTCVPDAYGGQKRELDLLQLELCIIEGQYVGARNQIQAFCQNRDRVYEDQACFKLRELPAFSS